MQSRSYGIYTEGTNPRTKHFGRLHALEIFGNGIDNIFANAVYEDSSRTVFQM